MILPPGRPNVLPGERLGQQDRSASVDRPMGVEHRSVEGAQGAVATAPSVVADQDVEMPERVDGGVDESAGCVGVGEVHAGVVDASVAAGKGLGDAVGDRVDPAGVGSPGLVPVVRGVVVQEQAGAEGGQAADRKSVV